MHNLAARHPPMPIHAFLPLWPQIDGVKDVHDLHVWNLSMGIPIMTAHVHVDPDAQVDKVRQNCEWGEGKLGIRLRLNSGPAHAQTRSCWAL